MTTAAPARSGGQILVDQLVAQGVGRVYCVPAESFLAVLDALRDSPIGVTVCRQEGGASMMAMTVGRLTGRPGVCFATRGPGAANAAPGVHIAEHDSAPMILFVGHAVRAMRGRGAFQEMDFRAVFGSNAKWAIEIDSAARIPEVIQRAFHTAMQGRPGPVVIALPEDVLAQAAAVADAPRVEPAAIWPGQTQMAELQKLLWAAKNPIAIIGGGGWSERAGAALMRFAERFDLPVAASFRCASLVDNEHPNYVGEVGFGPSPKLKARIEAADLVLMIGDRMSEVPSQAYTLLAVPLPRQTLVHVNADPLEIGRVYHPRLGVIATPPEFCAALEGLQPPKAIAWSEAARAARAEYLAWSDVATPNPGPVQLSEIVLATRQAAPDAFFTNGAGNFSLWPGRFLRFRHFNQQIGPTSGSMGFGVPSAVAAKQTFPNRTVVAFCGDGDFLMNGQEFATAVQYELPFVAIVIDNGMFGTIRMHQERVYPGRLSATGLRNPDFAAYARAFGGHGEMVEETGQFLPAFTRALRSGKPAILHVKIDPEAITPTTTLTEVREAALKRRKEA